MSAKSTFGAKPEQLDRLLGAIGLEKPGTRNSHDRPVSSGAKAQKPGTRIGRYRLVRVLGEGGMGVVYLARQQQPIQRDVALKLIKPGMDSKRIIRRFALERQTLARLEHPNIAHILDAGMTKTGRPYFVMEYVQGLGIHEHCDQHELSIKDRLSLFLQVCAGLKHAHQKGVIHRDIKPSNVLVTFQDAQAVPKIIDFGVAQATGQKRADKTLVTAYAHAIGTPAYMSPEQTQICDLDVDTRTDIYSLGVLLYKLLTGVTPFAAQDLGQANRMEMQRIICEQEPPRPSTQLTRMQTQTSHQIRNQKSKIANDLDWIVMKSLEKDRTRRYETVHALADDIRRHLDHEPILAAPPNRLYRLGKFLRRHRARLVIGASILAMITVALVLATLFVRSEGERQQIQQQMRIHEQTVALDTGQRHLAEGRYQEALNQLRPLRESERLGSQARLLCARLFSEMGQVDEAVSELERLLSETPDIAGAANYLLATLYTGVDPVRAGAYQQRAEALLARTAEALFLRALTVSNPEDIIRHLSQALELDPGHCPSRKARALAYHALKDHSSMLRDVEVLIALRPQDAVGYALRAIGQRETGQFEEAIKNHNHALGLCNINTELPELHNQRRKTYLHMGKHRAALADARRCAELVPNQLIYGFHVFTALVSLGDYEAAEQHFQRLVGTDSTEQITMAIWARRFVVDMMGTGQSLDIPLEHTAKRAFSSVSETITHYRRLQNKATRLLPRAYGQISWSPDGKRLAYGRSDLHMGQSEMSATAAPALSKSRGIEVLDLESGATRLLVGFGRDPAWSPDGRYLAFVRDRDKRIRGHQEEVWIIPGAGGESRRIAWGAQAMWAQDAKRIFFHSRIDKMLYTIRIDDPAAQPVPIMCCPSPWPALSPDEKHLAYAIGRQLRVVDLTSNAVVNQWTAPVPTNSMIIHWSPEGRELSLGGSPDSVLGLWIFDRAHGSAQQVLDAPAQALHWSPDGSQLGISMRDPFEEIWLAERDPRVPTHQALAPALTRREFLRHLVETDPLDVNKCAERLVWLGTELYRAGEYEEALETSARIESLQPDMGDAVPSARSRTLRALALYQLGRQDQARTALAQQPAKPKGVRTAHREFGLGIPTCLESPVNSSHLEWAIDIGADNLTLFIVSDRPSRTGRSRDLWITTRASTDDAWGQPENLGSAVNTRACETGPSISTDGLVLHFSDGEWFEKSQFPPRPDGYGDGDIWMTTRASYTEDWSSPLNLGPPINSPIYEGEPDISADGLSLYFASGPGRTGEIGGVDLWVTTRASVNDQWREPENLGPRVNSSYTDWSPNISTDGLMLLFMSNRPDHGSESDNYDIWVTTRQTVLDNWSEPVKLGAQINGPHIEGGPSLSADGSTLFFHSTRPGGPGFVNLWQADIAHMSPAHGEAVTQPRESQPVAYWPMDETEGAIARNRLGHEQAALNGNPIWHPIGGIQNGALQMDGVDDCVIPPFILNPAQGSFSVFAWIKGSAPRGVIMSQADGSGWGSNWLRLAPAQGTLMSELGDPQAPLISNQAIAHGLWHHIGLVWDGSYRYLYVDGVQTASDHASLTMIPSDGSLYWGAGKTLDPATAWPGLIDEVRVYAYALSQAEVKELHDRTAFRTGVSP